MSRQRVDRERRYVDPPAIAGLWFLEAMPPLYLFERLPDMHDAGIEVHVSPRERK